MSFWEIGVVLVVALLVLGPKRLPSVAKEVGKMWARLEHAFRQLKKEIDPTQTDVTKPEEKDKT